MHCCGNFSQKKKLHQESLLRPVPVAEYQSLDKENRVELDSMKVGIGKYSLFNSVRKYPKLEKAYIFNKEKFYERVAKATYCRTRPEARELRMLFDQDNEKFRRILQELEPPFRLKWDVWMLLVLDQRYTNVSEENFNTLINSKAQMVEDIVNKDVPRTFNDREFFGGNIKEVKVGREMLYKLCKAVGTYFTNIGYTQGFNFLAAFLLEISGGQELDCLNFILQFFKNERFLFIGCFDDRFPLVFFLNYLFHKKLEQIDPELETIIKKLGFPDELWLHKWFMSLFTGYFPTYFCSRVMDIVLVTDIFSSVSIALSLTLYNRKAFFKSNQDFSYISEYLNDLGANEDVMENAFKILKQWEKYKLENDFLVSSIESFKNSRHFSCQKFDRYARVFKKYLTGQDEISQMSISVYEFDHITDAKDLQGLNKPINGLNPPLPSNFLQSRLETIKEESPERMSVFSQHGVPISQENQPNPIANPTEIKVQSKFSLKPQNTPPNIEVPDEEVWSSNKQVSSIKINENVFKRPNKDRNF